ncbi:MAG: thiamine phosphate synthase [Acidobacteria bacterium]|nr:thiamine phosphate synthase [Acidobacteriota bacterium]
MIRYCITDRRLRGVQRRLVEGVGFVQVRDKELSARALTDLVRTVMGFENPHGTRVLVNTRMDVALACGAHGVHLPAGSIAVNEWRRIAPDGFVIGVSCHTIEELRQAEGEGADYAVYGPVFAPLSKVVAARPVGLEGLAAGCAAVRMPVFALGGIQPDTAAACVKAGAAGVAGITMFAGE